MADSFLDHLPSLERERIRKRLRSPEEYERLRERVKGPEDLEKELAQAEIMADLQFELNSSPETHEKLSKALTNLIIEGGPDQVFETDTELSNEAKDQLKAGKFVLRVLPNPVTSQDHLCAVPEGNVQESIPVKLSLAQQWSAQLSQAA